MAIGETILGAVLNVVFDKLASRQVIEFFKSSKLNQSLLNKLKHLMLVAEKLLADAENRQFTESAVKSWLNDLKHLFFRAEEIVSEIATEALRSSMDQTPDPESLRIKVRNWLPFLSSSSSFVDAVNSELNEVVTQLDDMVSLASALNLREGSVRRTSERVTSYMLDDTQVFGREQEKEELLNFLHSEEVEKNRLTVVAIVGMGGLGKTTLAKMVYNDDSLVSFDLKAWVYVSDEFDISRVTKSIIECITHQSYSGSLELSVVQYQLSKIVKDKKILLVLDDVWNEKDEDWEHLRAPLAGGAWGSKVIVTTRNDGVATTMRTAHVMRLPRLSDEDGWLLISKQVFGVNNLNPKTEFVAVGRKIVQKCNGLPLAIKTIGGVLRCKEDIKEWEAILENSVWDLADNKSNVVPALRLSYYHLPSHLKRCFSYCCIFPKGHRFDRRRLVLLWMAENFVLPIESKRRIEDIGEEYLFQLLSCSFFETTDNDKLLMHDLMHDLAQDISGEFFAMLEDGETTPKISEKIRYISYFRDHFEAFTRFEHIPAAKYARTFYQLPRWASVFWTSLIGFDECYLSKKIPDTVIPQFYCLRVLCLTNYEVLKLPESIENLKQLRFLDVSRTGIRELPESVCKLYHLQTILLSKCGKLERLPANMSGLMSLRHLDIKETSSLSQMPLQMSKLTSLQTLTDFVVSKHGGASIKELRELRQIRGRLAVRGLQNVSSPVDAFDANLSSREYLTDLALEFDYDDIDDSQKCLAVLENLKPPVILEELTIKNYLGTRFPSWLDTHCLLYTNIVNLCLIDCSSCFSLPPLGELPSLMDLEIIGMDHITIVGAEFYGYGLSNPFPALHNLLFGEMKIWKEWLEHEMRGRGLPFPCLEKLTLRNCPKFEGTLPVHLPSLKELHTEGCRKLPNSFLQPLSGVSFPFSLLTSLKLHYLVQLVSLPPEIHTLSNLETLSLNNCPSLKSLAENRLPPNIRCLKINECEILECLPETMVHLTQLHDFEITRCPSLNSNDKYTLPTSLADIKIESCERWQFALFDIANTCKIQQQHYSSLKFVSIKNMGITLVSFPLGIFPNLQELELYNCSALEAVYIPRRMDLVNLTSLQMLIVAKCPKLKYIGKTEKITVVDLPASNLLHLRISSCGIVKPLRGDREGLPCNLETLQIDGCDEISSQSYTRSLLMFSCLKHLYIHHHFAECFPDKGTLPTSITFLALINFPKLKFLNGEALKSLTSLHKLWIKDCPNLECLPEEGLPPSLGLFYTEGCPLLEERCKRDNGHDWPKIQHLPCVAVNDVVI